VTERQTQTISTLTGFYTQTDGREMLKGIDSPHSYDTGGTYEERNFIFI